MPPSAAVTHDYISIYRSSPSVLMGQALQNQATTPGIHLEGSMDFSAPELYQRPCDVCGGTAHWVLEEEADTQVRCAECGPPEEMEIPKIGYCCESCNGSLEDFVRRLGPRHNRVIRSGDLTSLARRLEAEKVPTLHSYRNPDYKVPIDQRGLEAVTLVRSFKPAQR